MINKKYSYSKVCGVAYNEIDINNIITFSINHSYKYYIIKHIADNDNTKDHYHFIISSDSKHRFNISTLLREEKGEYLFGPNLFQPLKSLNSYLRYMLHLDYEDKKKYDIVNIISNDSRLNIEYYVYHQPSSKENKDAEFQLLLSLVLEGKLQSLKETITFCLENSITYQSSWTFTLTKLF